MFLIEIQVDELEHADDINSVLRAAEENGEIDFPFSVSEAVTGHTYDCNAEEETHASRTHKD
jgi:hypothetical protein